MKQTPNTPRAMKHVVQSNEALITTLDPSALSHTFCNQEGEAMCPG